jgi:capsular polysaccharide biosynthesis protein
MTGPGLALLVRRWWWLIAAGAVAGALVAWLISSNVAKTYQAETRLLVGPVSGDFSTLHASGQLGKTYADLAASRPVVAAAARSARLRLSPAEIAGAVTATSNDITRIIDIQVRHRDPLAAAHLADAVAAQLLLVRRRLPIQQADAAKTILGDPALATLPHAERQAVRMAIGRFGWSSTAGDLAVVEGAVASGHPVAPRVQLLVLLAALGGALVAVVWASVREAMVRAASEDSTDDFEVESFLPSANGADREAAVPGSDRWLGEPRATELR